MPDQLWDITRPGIYIDKVTTFSCKGFWNLVGKGFLHAATLALSQIASRPVGRQLLARISAHNAPRGDCVVIKQAPRLTGTMADLSDNVSEHREVLVPWYSFSGTMDAAIGKKIESEKTRLLKSGEYQGMIDERNEMQGVLSFITLAHELIHALHILDGQMPSKAVYKSEQVALDHEEARTVGLGPYSREEICENTIRREHRLEPRTAYSGNTMAGLRVIDLSADRIFGAR